MQQSELIERLPRDDTGRITSDYAPSALEIEVARRAICREFGNNGTDGYYIRILKAVHAAALSSMEAGAKVKPLEWRGPLAGFYEADGFGGVIQIMDALRRDEPGNWILYPTTNERRKFDTLDAAKAAAQADYERRILSALEPSPASVPAGARVTDEMVEALNGWKCNNCGTIFTHEKRERDPGNDGGACCPHCKAHGQYTYPYNLHRGDPCINCGVSHDEVEPGACEAALAQPASGGEGWVLVPKKPTEAMKAAVRDIGGVQALAFALAAWPDMLAAVSSQESTLPDDVRELVIAARCVMDQGDMTDEHMALDRALAPFSSRVPYDDEPLPTSPREEGGR